MDFIIELIIGLFGIKNPEAPKYNAFINALIAILVLFGIFITILWACSKFGMFT